VPIIWKDDYKEQEWGPREPATWSEMAFIAALVVVGAFLIRL
jgi:hypothetical protein